MVGKFAITHVTSSTGVVYPVARLCRAARERNIWCHVDGAQSGGMLAVDLRQWGYNEYGDQYGDFTGMRT